MLALAGIPGFALSGDETFIPPAYRRASGQVSQAASPPAPVGTQRALRTESALDYNPGTDLGESCGSTDWSCGPPSSFWVRGEYLHWWIKESQTPVLITTGVPGVTPLPGVLGQLGTTVLFGGSDQDNPVRDGGRFTGGLWLNECRSIGLEASYFFLASQSERFDDNSPLIARPFFDVSRGTANAQLVAFPGVAAGEIHVNSSSRLQGAELNVLCIPCCSGEAAKSAGSCDTDCGGNYSLNLLGGVRYLQLDDSLGITELTRVNPALPAGRPLFGGSTIRMVDQFDTHSYFYGAQVGARGEYCWGPLFVDVLGKVALGTTHQVVDIRGTTAITSPARTTVVIPAGFLASGSNSGRFTRNRFAVVPELGVNVGCHITRHLRATVGYTFLYWSSVVRAGDQVDVGLSGTQIPTDSRFNPAAGPARPAVNLRDTDFWAQGLSVGLEFRY